MAAPPSGHLARLKQRFEPKPAAGAPASGTKSAVRGCPGRDHAIAPPDPRDLSFLAPIQCSKRLGPKHVVCRRCVEEAAEAALVHSEVTGEPPVMLCLAGKCEEPWTDEDWLKLPSQMKAFVKRWESLLFRRIAAAVPGIIFCPKCGVAGWVDSKGCPSAICTNPQCNTVFCSLCAQPAHRGPCGAPHDEPELVDDAEKFYNLDRKLSIINPYFISSYFEAHPRSPTSYSFSSRKTVASLPDRIAFTLTGLFWSQFHETLLQVVKQAGFESLEKMFPNDYRSNDRLLARSVGLAKGIFNSIVGALQPEDLRHTPMGPTGEGLWLPCGVNPVLKFARYRPGCLFKAHRDGVWAPGIDHMSVFTVVIYLNSGFKGGNTRFFDDGGKVVGEVKPEPGKVLVFSQNFMHDGAAIESGEKYILRSEVMYRRVKSVLDRSPAFLAASEDLKRISAAYRDSNAALERGEKEKFLLEYLDAIELQAKPRPVSQRLPIPDDVVIAILDFLSDREILRSVAAVNRHMYRLAHDNMLWKRRMHRCYSDTAALGAQDLSVDWLSRYSSEVKVVRMPRAKHPDAVLDLGTAYIKTWCRGVESLSPSFYVGIKEAEWAHGQRTEVDGTRPANDKELKAALAAPPGSLGAAVRAISEDGSFTNKGREYYLRHVAPRATPKSEWSSFGTQRQTHRMCVVRDLWAPQVLADVCSAIGQVSGLVSHSSAVARSFDTPSALVLTLGHSLTTLTLVLNYHVSHVLPISGFKPTEASARVLAKEIHNVFTDRTPFPEINEAAAAAAALVTSPDVSAEVRERVTQRLKLVLERYQTVNLNTPDSARQAISHTVLLSGGRVAECAPWVACLRTELGQLTPQWRVLHSQKPAFDAVLGAVKCQFSDPFVYLFCTAPKPVQLPARILAPLAARP